MSSPIWWTVDDVNHGTYVVQADSKRSAKVAAFKALKALDTYGRGWCLGRDVIVEPIKSDPAGHHIEPGRGGNVIIVV